MRFWDDMKKGIPSKEGILMIGNPHSGNPEYATIDELSEKILPDDIATIPETNKIIKNLYSKYDIYTDENGNVLRYNSEKDNLIEIYNNLHLDSMLITDSGGWVSHGWDWKNRQLINLEIQFIIPNIYNVQCDESGNAISFQKTWSSTDTEAGTLPDRLKNLFTSEVAVIEGDAHYAFPGICSGKNGVLHAFYRKGTAHMGIDGCVMYSYSKDFGATWSQEVIAFEGGQDWEGWKSDWRDSKVIRMSNGKFLLSQTQGYAKENGAEPPNNIGYDAIKYKVYAIIYNAKADGTLDIANPNKIQVPKPIESSWAFGAGGLIEENGIIYYTVYGNKVNSEVNSVWLLRSLDYGLTWETVSNVADGYNENALVFFNGALYCIMRGVVKSTLVVKSYDNGKTWEEDKFLHSYYHGLYALNLGDTVMIAGRAYTGRTTITFMNKYCQFVIEPIAFGTTGDSSYAQICTFENYVHIIYYSELGNNRWGVFTRKVERNRVIGLSY